MKQLKSRSIIVSDDDFQLVKSFPLRVIRGDADHEEAVVFLSRLIGRKEPGLSHGEREYADALARLIRDYDQTEYPMLRSRRTPLEKLKYVMAESRTKPVQLSEILGVSRPLTSHILTGKRNLTLGHMRKLGDYFKLEPGYFL